MRLTSKAGGWCLGIVLALAAAASAEELREALSHRGEKWSIEGVGNFGRMNDRLYRGAQPTNDGFRHLRDLGIGTIVRLSFGDEGDAEGILVRSLGMRFIGLPWSSVHDPQTDEVVEFLTFAESHPDERIFVHCRAGADRTGVFVALYRIVLDRWSAADAIDEMKAFHYRYVFLPHLQSYVEAFPRRLRADPRFVPLEVGTR